MTPPEPEPLPGLRMKTIRIVGTVPPEVWNRLGTKLLPKLRSGSDLKFGLELSVTVNAKLAGSLTADPRQTLSDLGLTGKVRLDEVV